MDVAVYRSVRIERPRTQDVHAGHAIRQRRSGHRSVDAHAADGWQSVRADQHNLGKSSDPDLEKEIIQDVGTYGKQLGQIGDALQVLINHVKLDKLTVDEKRAILALQFQLAEVDRLKAKRK
jgi:hypothetical protein